ncbi:MAG: hypothetical protein KF892_08475 [Rhizobacter sp.]|nr:hypothetical protein [Rhizobacter sp.]
MYDDIRIRLDIPHEPFDKVELRPDGTRVRPKRIKPWGPTDPSIRVRSVKKEQQLVIEGSFNTKINGHSVVGSMNLRQLVKRVVDQVLKQLGIVPTPEQQQAIDEGRVTLERLDVVGFLRVNHLGGVPIVLQALDVGLAGSKRNRMVFPKETVVYHSHSSNWSLMFYDKAQHLRTKYADTWKKVDPRIKDIARKYVRIELRQFGKELKRLGWNEVRDVDEKKVKELFEKHLRGLLDDIRKPYPHLAAKGAQKLTKDLLRGLLATAGVDVISGLGERAQRRVRKALKDKFGVDLRADSTLPRKYRRTLDALQDEPAFPIRHGAPRKVRKAGLLNLT